MNNQTLTCPVCEEGRLTESTFADDFKHGKKTLHIDGLECYLCNNCGADPVFPEQIRRNHLSIADSKRVEDDLLTGAKIKEIRNQLGLSQSDAARIFGGGDNAFSKYERGDVIQSKAMDKLLRLTAKHQVNLLELCSFAGMPVKHTNIGR
ncbi:MAG: type II toxin-antitoxin system MqsA family antitoxin [Xanthomonadales bacterium]|nr:type II toxin-antitoxin system MqsA family antitoxin [Xanthomonadales bacterium]